QGTTDQRPATISERPSVPVSDIRPAPRIVERTESGFHPPAPPHLREPARAALQNPQEVVLGQMSLSDGSDGGTSSNGPSSGTNLNVRRVSDSGGEVGWSRLTFISQVRN